MSPLRQFLLLLALFLLLAHDLLLFIEKRVVSHPLQRKRLRAPTGNASRWPADGMPLFSPPRARAAGARPPVADSPSSLPFPLPAPQDYAALGVATTFARARHCSQAPRTFSGSPACNCSSSSLEEGAGGLRSAEEVAQRLNFSSACASLHPYSLPMAMPPLRHRAALVEHGALLNTAIMQWAAALGLPMPQHHISLGYTGPFIEDHFRDTFYAPVRHPTTLAQARAREEAVQGQLFAGEQQEGRRPSWSKLKALGLGTTLVLATCIAGQCQERTFNSTADLPPEFTSSSGSSAAQQLYLQVPYDSELFHPLVPLFVPWESSSVLDQMVRASLRVGGNLATALATYERVLARWEAAKASNSTKLRRPTKPSYDPYAAALEAYPHVHSLKLKDVLPRLQALLAALMRPDVYYVTVTQRPEGPWLEAMAKSVIRPLLGRTIVLSSGGGGHVALPLLARELPLLPVGGGGVGEAAPAPPPPATAQHALLQLLLQRNVSVPQPQQARHALSFFGNLRTGARERASAVAAAALGPRYHLNRSSVAPLEWVPPFVNTRLAFAPRGVGSTSFRLYEALQLGVPPVYIFDGLYPWLPYAHPAQLPLGTLGPKVPVPPRFWAYPAALPPPPPAPLWPRIAYVLHEQALNASLRNASAAMPELSDAGPGARDAAWWGKRRAIESLRHSHFTYAGIMAHIRAWLANPYAAELYCAHAVPPDWARFGLAPPPPPPPPPRRIFNSSKARK